MDYDGRHVTGSVMPVVGGTVFFCMPTQPLTPVVLHLHGHGVKDVSETVTAHSRNLMLTA